MRVVITYDTLGGEEGENTVDSFFPERVDTGVLVIALCTEIGNCTDYLEGVVFFGAQEETKGFPAVDFNAGENKTHERICAYLYLFHMCEWGAPVYKFIQCLLLALPA